jgi:hypothetical protein
MIRSAAQKKKDGPTTTRPWRSVTRVDDCRFECMRDIQSQGAQSAKGTEAWIARGRVLCGLTSLRVWRDPALRRAYGAPLGGSNTSRQGQTPRDRSSGSKLGHRACLALQGSSLVAGWPADCLPSPGESAIQR